MTVTKNTSIEELVEELPASIDYLSKNKIQCVVCGEPIWGTLEEVALSKGFSQENIDVFVKELNQLTNK